MIPALPVAQYLVYKVKEWRAKINPSSPRELEEFRVLTVGTENSGGMEDEEAPSEDLVPSILPSLPRSVPGEGL